MVKNSPSKLEGVPEGEGVCLAAKVILCKVVYYNVDSIIFVWLLITSPTLTNTKMRNDAVLRLFYDSLATQQ